MTGMRMWPTIPPDVGGLSGQVLPPDLAVLLSYSGNAARFRAAENRLG
jgi:hypothetical protein